MARRRPESRADQGRKRATTLRLFVRVTTQDPCPEQAPLQSRKRPPDGDKVTRVPAGKLAPQAPAVHRIPAGELVTVPGPPVTLTVRVYIVTGEGGGDGAGGGEIVVVWPEPVATFREDTSTASKALPGTSLSSLTSWSSFQRASGAPLKNHALPLSASIIP